MSEVMPPRARSARVRSPYRRSRIVDAAGTIAATGGGYAAVTMRDVAELAQVSTATLYRHFRSKDHLLVATLGKWLEEFDCRVDVELSGRDQPFDRLWFLVDTLFTALRQSPYLAEAMARSYVVARGAATDQVEDIRTHLSDIFAAALHGRTDELDGPIAELLADVWAANVLAVSHGRISDAELRRRLFTTVRLLEARHGSPKAMSAFGHRPPRADPAPPCGTLETTILACGNGYARFKP